MATLVAPVSNAVCRSAIAMWYLDPSSQLGSQRVDQATLLTFDRNEPLQRAADSTSTHAIVQPIRPQDDRSTLVAVVFIPDQLQHALSRNGIPLPAGMHGLAHADLLDNEHQSYWISRHATAEHTYYDPAVHGPDRRCFMTRAPLAPGEAITICPGTPDTVCTAIYKASTWEKVMRPGTPLKCAQCGYHPGLATWKPTPPTGGKRGYEYLKYFER